MRLGIAALALALPIAAAAQSGAELKPASAFGGIADRTQRSVALFQEMGKVLQHPRCVNCHPAGDRPLQGDDGHLHVPAVVRGEGDIGPAGLHCPACHQAQNYDAISIVMPGHPEWHLAPTEMAWEKRSLGQICAQIKDPARNGGRNLNQLVDHLGTDSLVGWGWSPGRGRTPAPGTQAALGDLAKAWVASGAACPPG